MPAFFPPNYPPTFPGAIGNQNASALLPGIYRISRLPPGNLYLADRRYSQTVKNAENESIDLMEIFEAYMRLAECPELQK